MKLYSVDIDYLESQIDEQVDELLEVFPSKDIEIGFLLISLEMTIKDARDLITLMRKHMECEQP